MLDIMLAAILALGPQTSTSWQVIDINVEQKRVLTVDIASKPANPRADAIIKARVFVTVDMPEITALTGYWSINCGNKTHQVSNTVTFDRNGVASEPDPDPLAWEATTAGTLFEAVEDYVCRGQVKFPGKVTTGKAPIAAANAFLTSG